MSNRKKVVVIGGGTGTFTVLKGLRAHSNLDITAVVTMADDGGSNRVLRDQFGLLPTSGIRQCIVALSEKEGLLRELFSYRYHKGTGISGMTFGNLFMAALSDITGSQKDSIEETCKLLGVRGNIYPVSYENTSLVATYEDGTEVLGEHDIDIASGKTAKQRITNLRAIPKISISEEAKNAIGQADLIVLGPGDLYTNTIANLIVTGVREVIQKSPAKLVFVMNLMSTLGETYNYKASDYLDDLSQYLDPDRPNHILINSDTTLPNDIAKKYASEDSRSVPDNLDDTWHQANIIRTPLISSITPEIQKGDTVSRSLVRHDSDLLASAIVSLLQST
jgi:uncharacterized cofD-like protein